MNTAVATPSGCTPAFRGGDAGGGPVGHLPGLPRPGTGPDLGLLECDVPVRVCPGPGAPHAEVTKCDDLSRWGTPNVHISVVSTLDRNATVRTRPSRRWARDVPTVGRDGLPIPCLLYTSPS